VFAASFGTEDDAAGDGACTDEDWDDTESGFVAVNPAAASPVPTGAAASSTTVLNTRFAIEPARDDDTGSGEPNCTEYDAGPGDESAGPGGDSAAT
jgi:hypothetical protein